MGVASSLAGQHQSNSSSTLRSVTLFLRNDGEEANGEQFVEDHPTRQLATTIQERNGHSYYSQLPAIVPKI
ncbi:hypothetical protein QR680_003949 [Steinernema hermaphroditum]|uniref:Uncharacterized protein n=1 Tax=Steinernema hermaphroditum TaxID=289476 RepID=A0AA39HM61_9BILA|nr:hypothetical protein QR680_003949 [Steinernema hermaphroditum]